MPARWTTANPDGIRFAQIVKCVLCGTHVPPVHARGTPQEPVCEDCEDWSRILRSQSKLRAVVKETRRK